MEISGQYLTYAEYLGLGGTLHPTPFKLAEFEARRKIDIRTQNRLVNCEQIPQEVKLCINKMINSIQSVAKTEKETANSGGKKSESTDGYSVTYMTADEISEIVKSKSKELDDIMYSYLNEVVVNDEKLMYPGV